MIKLRRLLLLAALAAVVLGFTTTKENRACGQQIRAMGTKDIDFASGQCLDGTGTCRMMGV